MTHVSVRIKDDKGKEQVFTTNEMTVDEAEALRHQIEREHIEAGSDNRWIRVGNHSVQSRQIQTISVQEPISISSFVPDDDDGPFFPRNMRL